jgi:hypothetical protein
VEEQISGTSYSARGQAWTTADQAAGFFTGGQNRDADIAALAAAVAETVPGLADRNGSIARLTEDGELIHVNLPMLRELISQSLCGMRIVPNGSKFQREFFTFEFAQTPNPGPRTAAMGLQKATRSDGPDDAVLRQVYDMLPTLLPRVIE